MLIAIPSKGRPQVRSSQKFITRATMFVPELEIDAYKRMGAYNLVPVPNSIIGITKTRNFILDYAQSIGERWVTMIDDDMKVVGWVEMFSHSMKHRRLTEPVLIREWEKLFELTEDLGYRIWGLSTDGAPRSVYPWRPFIFHTYITASCMGILEDGTTRFDESYPVKEDYELCLRCIRDDGGVLGARYLYWVNEHWETPGGCKDYRTAEIEKDVTRRLISTYPGFIRRVTRGGSNYSIHLDF